MFENQKVSQVEQQIDCSEFIDLYARFLADTEKYNQMVNMGVSAATIAPERLRMGKFADKLDNAWLALTEDQRGQIVALLLVKKLLPAEVKSIMQVFGATVVKLGP